MRNPTANAFGAPIVLTLLLLLPACGDERVTSTPPAGGATATAGMPSGLFVDSAPAGAVGVRDAKTTAEVGKDIVLRARIGGRKKPFVDGRAVMVVADVSLPSCADNPDDHCLTPWDYCCETKDTILANTATVQVVDADGKPVTATLQDVHGMAPLQDIVVKGSVRSTESGLVVDAREIWVSDE